MAEHKVKGGCTLTDEEIARLGEAWDRGDYPGEPGDWIVHPKGRPDLSEDYGRPAQGGYPPLPKR